MEMISNYGLVHHIHTEMSDEHNVKGSGSKGLHRY